MKEPKMGIGSTLAVEKDEGAEISWANTTATSGAAHLPRGDTPRGQMPVLVLLPAKRTRLNLIITNQGGPS
ncbi:hypothetical protein QU481_09470 [Crenobacter sp. SG2303]|uniref:Uncharacterized protein n=1 Tax=Crenobacter oryzisoli TaxID=3056844 RepID=A0ABT7XMX4_9NEIS|nr:hypothetical protein [Crenobacter sp. SG2303]MDN0075115.1 hypothetical protein [Crenobacter sp. SG2303]